MIYFIVTTSLFNNCGIRQSQYVQGITKLKQIVGNHPNASIIIVENNGERATFLDALHPEVYYTRNNSIKTGNKGIKELQDVRDCIEHYKIQDGDFIVKMTGRYILDDDSEFMDVVLNADHLNYDSILRYGSFMKPCDYKMYDSITGLIGMTCKYVKQIVRPTEHQCVEWMWAKATELIADEKIHIVKQLGINIAPNPDCNNYFKV